MTPILWRITAALALVCALIAAVLIYGQKQYRAGHTAATAAISAELAASAQKQVEQARQASADYQTAKAENEQKERVRYVQVQKIIERPVYRNVCLDADGLRELNAAIANGH